MTPASDSSVRPRSAGRDAEGAATSSTGKAGREAVPHKPGNFAVLVGQITFVY
jgi:hypothetical protein